MKILTDKIVALAVKKCIDHKRYKIGIVCKSVRHQKELVREILKMTGLSKVSNKRRYQQIIFANGSEISVFSPQPEFLMGKSFHEVIADLDIPYAAAERAESMERLQYDNLSLK